MNVTFHVAVREPCYAVYSRTTTKCAIPGCLISVEQDIYPQADKLTIRSTLAMINYFIFKLIHESI